MLNNLKLNTMQNTQTVSNTATTFLANNNVTFATNGYWASVAKPVSIVDMQLTVFDKTCGELRVYFDSADWDVETDGLIYNDTGFEQHLLQFLANNKINYHSVSYSEQGLQGDDYVSFDVERSFIKTWNARFSND